MTITAKYAGTCKKCGGHISVGDKIEWERGTGASHCTCPAAPATAKMAAIRRRPAPRSRPARKRLTCRSCGQSGYSGSYPFSTCASSGLCDDCF